jgi:hypothetical protein
MTQTYARPHTLLSAQKVKKQREVEQQEQERVQREEHDTNIRTPAHALVCAESEEAA